ncbi:zinc finger protein 250-like [Esox lucius]|uniref:C2H2-type domain-containing protein n=1 Tax=Esox lucius TaxID=8010 RepID=A0AAY5KY18_ESOLU|nr:zinc finger protein 250-like [Esox lucius]XP_034146916.1 zinc finger protein 250-like [Esox lucius]
MSKLQTLRVFLNDRLTAAALEIFGAVEKTVVEYQKENDRLRKQLLITPEIPDLCRIEPLELSPAVLEVVPVEQQNYEQEWSPSLELENPEHPQIKEEQQELWTSQQEEQLQGLEADVLQFKVTPSCVKSDFDHENPFGSMTFAQSQNVEDRERDSKPVDLKHFDAVVHLSGSDISGDPPPDRQNDATTQSSAVTVGLEGLYSTPWHPNPPMGEHYTQPSTSPFKTHCCRDCGESFALTSDLQRHVTLSRFRVSECSFCKQQFKSTCKLKAHVQLCHIQKLCSCPFCGKTFKCKGVLSRHMRIHTGEKPFSCSECGKSFNHSQILKQHKLTHTGEKPFRCSDCGKSFNRKENLTMHIRTHTGEKPFCCGICGKSFNVKGNLTAHKLTHTRDKPHGCSFCGKTFIRKDHLLRHVNNCHRTKYDRQFGNISAVQR